MGMVRFALGFPYTFYVLAPFILFLGVSAIKSFVVPSDAIIFNRNWMQVAVVSDGKAEIRKVKVTRDMGTQVEWTPESRRAIR